MDKNYEKFNPELIDLIRRTSPQAIAEQLVTVQPIGPSVFMDLWEAAKTEQELIQEGYKPVSHMGLMWIKEEDTNNDKT